MLLYALKATGMAAVLAATELWAQGDCAMALAAIPMLALMWYATRLHARRRARPGGSE